MYFKLKPQSMGRDAFERLCKEQDLMSKRSQNQRRTTDSTGVIRFENRIQGLTLTYQDQVWQSDITYYEVKGRFYYLTFIVDAFSRRILGHSVSKRLFTEDTTLPALRQAIKARGTKDLTGTIFHSDGGGQYYDTEFLKLTAKHKLLNSMCEFAWENGKAERINGVIKNNYLRHRRIADYEGLQKEVDRCVLLYNTSKPHIALQRRSPATFENETIHLQQQTRPMMTKSLNANQQILGASSPKKSEQTKPQNPNVLPQSISEQGLLKRSTSVRH
jgi:putative transposase